VKEKRKKMKPGVWGIITLCLVACVSAANYRLVWEDNFDTLDLTKWEHELTLGGGGNWEFQLYANNRSTSFVQDGTLYIRPMLTSDIIGEANVRGGYRMDMWGSQPSDMCTGNAFYGCERTSGAGGNYLNPVRSARIRSVNSINIKYGKVEVRAKLPLGDWIWPAIWMLPKHNTYGQWPASGEIDLMESRGNKPGSPQHGVDYVASTLHWGPHYPENGYMLTTKEVQAPSGATFADDFHVYGLEWNEKGLRTYVDSTTMLQIDWTNTDFWTRGGWSNTPFNNPWVGSTSKGAPFDHEFYLLLNVAVGGTNGYFKDGAGDGKPWSNLSPNSVNEFYNAVGSWYPTWQSGTRYSNALAIDYVRVYTDLDAPGASYSPISDKVSSNPDPKEQFESPTTLVNSSPAVPIWAVGLLGGVCLVAIMISIVAIVMVFRFSKNGYQPLN